MNNIYKLITTSEWKKVTYKGLKWEYVMLGSEEDTLILFPGGLRSRTLAKTLQERPERILFHAVKGMLPKNRLGRKMIKKLRVYAGTDHPHEAQKPEVLPDNLRKI